jgi:hypothetical protein
MQVTLIISNSFCTWLRLERCNCLTDNGMQQLHIVHCHTRTAEVLWTSVKSEVANIVSSVIPATPKFAESVLAFVDEELVVVLRSGKYAPRWRRNSSRWEWAAIACRFPERCESRLWVCIWISQIVQVQYSMISGRPSLIPPSPTDHQPQETQMQLKRWDELRELYRVSRDDRLTDLL